MFGSRTSSLNSVAPEASAISMDVDILTEEVVDDSLKEIGNTSEEITETTAPAVIFGPPAPKTIKPIPSSRIDSA